LPAGGGDVRVGWARGKVAKFAAGPGTPGSLRSGVDGAGVIGRAKWGQESLGMLTITGTVGSDGKYLVTGIPVATETHTVLKLAFENNTAGTNLQLCAGSDADFAAGTAGMTLSGSGGPGFQFLTIIDTHTLSGMVIYVLRAVGSADSQFTLTID
jgi:hypothetical protein